MASKTPQYILFLCGILLAGLYVTFEWNTRKTVRRNPYLPGMPASKNYTNLLKIAPPRYFDKFKNPCWVEEFNASFLYRENYFYTAYHRKFADLKRRQVERFDKGSRWRLRCLPYFYVAGAPHCGTDVLFSYLMKHPMVRGGLTDTSNWWGDHRVAANSGMYVPISHYVDLFDQTGLDMTEHMEYNSTSHHFISSTTKYQQMIIGDASPSTLWKAHNWRKLPENWEIKQTEGPDYFTPHYIRHVTPHAKIIMLVRNPSKRLYVNYTTIVNGTLEHFHKQVENDTKNITRSLVRASLWGSLNNVTKGEWAVKEGMYYAYMERWFQVFPRNQILVLDYDEVESRPIYTMSKVCKFLGIEQLSSNTVYKTKPSPVPKKVLDLHKNQTKLSNQTIAPKLWEGGKLIMRSMLRKTRILLDEFYIHYNEFLSDMLREPKFLWEPQ